MKTTNRVVQIRKTKIIDHQYKLTYRLTRELTQKMRERNNRARNRCTIRNSNDTTEKKN